MNLIKKFLQKLKKINLATDELSLFLIFISLILSIFIALFRLNRFVFLSWIFLFIAYWRSSSKKRLQRFKENQIFLKYYYCINTCLKNFTRRFARNETHIHFYCKLCRQQLRIPKKTAHIKVTCPKCNYSFTKKTIRGYMRK